MTSRLLQTIFIFALMSMACQSASDQLKQEAKTVASYAATVQIVLEERQSERVSRRYAQDALESMDQNIQTEMQSIEKLKTTDGRKQELLGITMQLQAAVREAVTPVQNEVSPNTTNVRDLNSRLQSFYQDEVNSP